MSLIINIEINDAADAINSMIEFQVKINIRLSFRVKIIKFSIPKKKKKENELKEKRRNSCFIIITIYGLVLY